MLGFLDNLFLKLEGKESSKKSTKKQPAKSTTKSLVLDYSDIKKPIEPNRIDRKTLNNQKLGLGSLLYHFLVDKSKAGLDGWKDDKEKFKTDLLNDIKTFLFGKWEKPWVANLIFSSTNKVISGFQGYNGNTFHNSVNILTLSQNAGESPYFIALKRLKKEGGTILDKEKVCSVLSYIPIKKDDNPEKIAFMLPMAHKVINLDYVDGIKKPKFKTIEFKNLELNEYVENFIKVLKATRRIPKVIYDQADQAYYVSNPPLYTTDEIHLVNINQFKDIGGYYSTLFHEIIHSTKNPKRLGRGGEKTNKLPYANEELVAEMGAMILCSELGLEYSRQNSLTYLNNWLKGVKGDSDNAMLEAYAFACDAVEYLIKGVNFEKLVPKSMKDRAKETNLPDNEPTPGGSTPWGGGGTLTKQPDTKKSNPTNKPQKIRAKVLDKTIKATANQAVSDLMELPKYKKIGAIVGTIIFKAFKDDIQNPITLSDFETFKLAMFQKAQENDLVEVDYKGSNEIFTLTDFGREFVAAVKGRLNTLHGKKYMNPLFGLGGINEVNEQFNHELDLLINGKIPKNHVFYLGETPNELYETGMPYLPVEMQAQRLNMKSKAGHHVFDLNNLKDLPLHVQKPIAVFQSLRREKSKVLFIELQNKGVNFIVAIEAGGTSKSRFLSVNSIRSIYPKDNIKDVLQWIAEYDLLERVCQKQKFLDWLNKQQCKSADVRKLIKESTKLIQNFENRNTSLNGVKARKNEFWTEINGEIRLVLLLDNGMIQWDDFTKGKLTGVRSHSELFKTKKEAENYFNNPLNGTNKLLDSNEVNKQFNYELDLLIKGKLPDNHVFYIGLPSENLIAGGISPLPIELSAKRLKEKSMQENHKFDLSLIKNLPDAIHHPIAVFNSKTQNKTKVVLTELKGNNANFLVILRLRTGINNIKVNDIKSIYPKTDINGLFSWITNRFMVWADKTKILSFISAQSTSLIGGGKRTKDYVTKLIQNFENGNTPLNGVKTPENNFGFTTLGQIKKPKTYKLKGDIGAFLGEYERQNYSIVLRGDKGAGKSRLLFQIINAFASKGLKTAFLSLEMAAASSVTNRYKTEYINPVNLKKIDISDQSVNYSELNAICKLYDVVAIDSWTKLKGMEQADFDRLQKENPQTIIIAIFQSTTGKVTRGGNMPEFDAGCVIHVHKGGIAECEKNRYATTDKKFNVFQKRIVEPEPAEMEV